jgi:hypothetical protein
MLGEEDDGSNLYLPKLASVSTSRGRRGAGTNPP